MPSFTTPDAIVTSPRAPYSSDPPRNFGLRSGPFDAPRALHRSPYPSTNASASSRKTQTPRAHHRRAPSRTQRVTPCVRSCADACDNQSFGGLRELLTGKRGRKTFLAAAESRGDLASIFERAPFATSAARSKRTCCYAHDMCAHPDALVNSNDAGAAARQAAAPALPALPELPLPGVPDDGSSLRQTAAPAPASCSCIWTSRVPIPKPRVSHRDTATTRTDTRFPKPHAPHDDPVRSGFPAHEPELVNRGSSNYQLDGNPKTAPFPRDHFKKDNDQPELLFESARNEGVSLGAS